MAQVGVAEKVRRDALDGANAKDLSGLLERATTFADGLAHRPNVGVKAAPRRELERCAELGLLMAPFPRSLGGNGLGVDEGTHLTLLRILAAVGGADLALGRIYEGHVNGVLLVLRYGSERQIAQLARDVRGGMLSGVWNTGGPELLRLVPAPAGFQLVGGKTFATGAAFVQRPIVTAEMPGGGWQMVVAQMDRMGAQIDRSFWHPLGMESSESFGVDFTGARVEAEQLIGKPGDFYCEPMFRAGAIRFSAVQTGAVMRLHQMFAEWLDERDRGDDPYQIFRLGEVAIAAQEAAMWVEKAAAVAEESFYRSEKTHCERMIECANMMRVAIERLATAVMQKVTAGVGAHGLLQPARFERVIRDLTMYLRQPAPDQTLAALGRHSLEKTKWRSAGSADGFWSDSERLESLPPKYFHRVYARNKDPWNFETSEYERRKYKDTLRALPRERYRSGIEVGCSIGVLTYEVAGRCDSLLGLDVTETALARARERCKELPGVHFACMRVPQEMPEGEFELVMLSEVGYYWTPADLEKAADRWAEQHARGGHLVLVHLTEIVPDYPQTGDQVHDYWLGRPEWKRVSGATRERYRIDVLERV